MAYAYKKAVFFILLFLAAFLLINPVCAGIEGDFGKLPLDNNNDNIITSDELTPKILSYLTEKYLNNCIILPDEDLSDAAYIYAKWEGKPKIIHDSTEQTITLFRPLKNVVVMNSEMLETLRSLNFSAENVAGVGKYTLQDSCFFPEYNTKPNVGSIWSPDYEKIIELEPDAVLMYATFMQDSGDEIQEKIQEMNPSIKFIRFDLYYPSTYIKEAETLASTINKEEEGEKLVSFYENNLELVNSVTENTNKDKRTKVYFESWDDYKSAAKGSGYNEKINIAGGVSIFEDATPEYPIVNPEEILIKNPNVVVKLIGSGKLAFGGYEDSDTAKVQEVYKTITARSGWQNLDAVKENHVHILSNDILGGPEYIIGTLYLAKWFYPKEFKNIDPAEVHQKYITQFQHLDFDVKKDGVFVSP